MRSWGGAGDVVVEDRPDPLITDRHQTVSGARRRSAIRDLWRRDVIVNRQHHAAMRFLDDCSRASGGGLVANLFAARGGQPRSALPHSQMVAIGNVRRIFHLLGLNDGTVLWRVLFQDWSLDRFDEANKVRHGTGARLLKAALTALADHYDEHDEKRGT